MEIKRANGFAEIIVAESEGHLIRLIGFSTDASKDDFTIAEEGYEYYKELVSEATS
jgi:hypothetical protein